MTPASAMASGENAPNWSKKNSPTGRPDEILVRLKLHSFGERVAAGRYNEWHLIKCAVIPALN